MTYSRWHRSLPASCYAYDLDFIEVRRGDPVALIETKRNGWRPNQGTDLQLKIMRELAKAAGIGAYLVEWTPSANPPLKHDGTPFEPKAIEKFIVEDLLSGDRQEMTEGQYRTFLAGLPQTASMIRRRT